MMKKLFKMRKNEQKIEFGKKQKKSKCEKLRKLKKSKGKKKINFHQNVQKTCFGI